MNNKEETTTIHLIYGYFDEENKYCYIGLTKDINRRHLEHQRKLNGKVNECYDSVMTYFISINKPLPEPVILISNLTPREAQEKEAYYIEYYRSEGYSIINIAKAGSLGGSGIESYWTYENCEAEAKKYETRTQFHYGSPRAYVVCSQNGWLDTFLWFVENGQQQLPFGYWSKEKCEETARKYTKLSDFVNNHERAYKVALEKGWLKDYTWLEKREFNKEKPRDYWTKEKCLEVSKEFITIEEFNNKYPGAYKAARKNGWLDEFTWIERKRSNIKPKNYWTEELCLSVAKECKTEMEFSKKYPGAKNASYKYGWINNYTWFNKKEHKPGYWNDKKVCMDEAKKYKSRTEFARGSSGAYAAALKYNWLKDYTWFEKKNKN